MKKIFKLANILAAFLLGMIFIGSIIFFQVKYSYGITNTICKKQAIKQKKQIDIRIKKQFNKNGSYKPLIKLIKEAMLHPKSFKHLHTEHFEYKEHIIVKMTFIAKTEEGSSFDFTVFAKYTYDNEIIDIITTELDKKSDIDI